MDHLKTSASNQIWHYTRSSVEPSSHGFLIVAVLCCLQLKRLSAAVGFGGGRSQLLEEGSLPLELLESPQSCVIDVTSGSSQALLSSSTAEWATSVKNIVQRLAQTPVILHTSAEEEVFGNYSSVWWFLNSLKLCTDKAVESSMSLKLVWLPFLLHVTSIAIQPVSHRMQVVKVTQKHSVYLF